MGRPGSLAFFPVLVSSAASAFDHTELLPHISCDLIRGLTVFVNARCFAKTPLRSYFCLIAIFKVFLSHFDGGSIVYPRGWGVPLIDLPVSLIACGVL